MKDFGFVYSAKLQRHARSVLVRFPDFPEALTEGADEQDALAQAADCLEEAIAGRIRRAEVIPVSRSRRGCRMIPVPALMAAKAALYLALREASITRRELAQLGKRLVIVTQRYEEWSLAHLRGIGWFDLIEMDSGAGIHGANRRGEKCSSSQSIFARRARPFTTSSPRMMTLCSS